MEELRYEHDDKIRVKEKEGDYLVVLLLQTQTCAEGSECRLSEVHYQIRT